MAEKINRFEVQTLVKNGTQLVEVLGRKEYRWAHLPQAINIPLWDIDFQSTSELMKIDRSSYTAMITSET